MKVCYHAKVNLTVPLQELITADMDGDTCVIIITAFSNVETSQRQEFIKMAKQLITEKMDGNQRARIIEDLAKGFIAQ